MRGVSPILVSVLLAAATISLAIFAYSFVFSTGSALEAQANHFSPAPAGEIVGVRSHEGTLCLHIYNPGSSPISPAFLVLRRSGKVVAYAKPLYDCNAPPMGTCWSCFPAHVRPGTYDVFLRWEGGTESGKPDVLAEGVPYDERIPWPSAWRLSDRRPILPTDVQGGGASLSPVEGYSPNTERNSIIMADVDRDGNVEIVMGGSSGVVVNRGALTLYTIPFSANKLLYVANHLVLGGESIGVYVFNGDGFLSHCSIERSPTLLSFGDVNGDEIPEIIFAADGNIHVYTLDCSPVATFPGDSFLAYDMDSDGKDEIFFTRSASVGLWDGGVVWERPGGNPRSPTLGFIRGEPIAFYADGNTVYGLDASGRVVISKAFPSDVLWVAAADLDGDGSTEIVAISDDSIYVSGSVDASYTLPSSVLPTPPLLVGLADPLNVVVAQENNIYVFSPDLTLRGSFSLEEAPGSTMQVPPAAGDVDGDWRIEIAVSYTGGVLLLDTGEAAGG